MKKLFAILLATMMLMSFAACGNDDDNNKGSILNGLTPITTTSSLQNQTTDIDVADNANNSSATISRGITTSTSYTNSSLGINFILPSGWSFYSDAELADLIGSTADALNLSNFSESLENGTNIYDMMAQNNTTNESVMVLFENVSNTGAAAATAEEYVSTAASQLEYLGYTASETTTTTLCGDTYATFTAFTTMQGVDITQQYYSKLVGNYAVSVILTSNGSSSLADLQALLY